MKVIERLRQHTGDVTIEEKDECCHLLGLEHQVKPSPSLTPGAAS